MLITIFRLQLQIGQPIVGLVVEYPLSFCSGKISQSRLFCQDKLIQT